MRRGEQAPWIVPEGLWQRIGPLLPEPAPRNLRYPGRKRVPDRQVLCGIVFVLRDSVGVPPAGTGFRVGHDLLAAP